MSCPDADEWVAAVSVEYQALVQRGVFKEVERPHKGCVHESQLVFSEKVGAEGEVTRKKAWLVTKGFMEIWGEDYWHTYSPTLGCDTLFLCLAYAATRDLEIHQLDAIAAYLNSNLHEEIFICPPEGVPVSPRSVWLLKKAIYGLKQAGLEWFRTLHNHIKSLGYSQSGHDPCLYIYNPNQFIVIYVDDLLVFTEKGEIRKMKSELTGRYEMRDLGEVCWFLAMEVTCDRVNQSITIDQQQYIHKILEQFELENARSVSTQMAANAKFEKLDAPEVDQHLYQSML